MYVNLLLRRHGHGPQVRFVDAAGFPGFVFLVSAYSLENKNAYVYRIYELTRNLSHMACAGAANGTPTCFFSVSPEFEEHSLA